jgi:hypothetical protein
MTHQQLVEEWKEKFTEFLNRGVWTRTQLLNKLELAMLAAAKGAAEAGKVEKRILPPKKDDGTLGKSLIELTALSQKVSFNTAISQSESQLEDYFKGA